MLRWHNVCIEFDISFASTLPWFKFMHLRKVKVIHEVGLSLRKQHDIMVTFINVGFWLDVDNYKVHTSAFGYHQAQVTL